MSRWLGFFVGLAVAITVVLTVVRPNSVSQQAAPPDPVAIPDRSPVTVVDEIDEVESLPSLPEAPVDKTPPPAQEEPEPEPAREAEKLVAKATLPDDAEDIPEPFAEPLPQFNWDAAPEADAGTELIALPDADIVVMDDASLTGAATSASAKVNHEDSTSTLPGTTSATVTARAETVPQPAVSGTRQWYAFWQPFGSEISAKGFSSRLERITGLDYRVVKVESGEYHVAFGYDDEASRLASLSTIEAATGLRLGGQSL